MAEADISVQRLRLVADRHVSGHALRARVEDALRISSKPLALAHRFVLLRRFRLRLPREASAQSLALQLEAQWRAIEALAEPLAQASSEAGAVWAADELQARLLLLLRWLRDEPTEAWFWRRLLPAARPSMPLPQRLAIALFEALDTAPMAAAQAQATQRRWQREALREIVAAGQWPALWAELQPLQRAALHALTADPKRHCRRWRRATLACRGREAPVVDPSSPFKGVALASPLPATAAPGSALRCRACRATRRARADNPARRGTRLQLRFARDGAVAAHRSATSHCNPPSRFARPAIAKPTWTACATAWAGLWFLLPLLQRQGLDDQPDAASVFAAVLQRAALRCTLDAAASAWVEQLSEHAAVRHAGLRRPTAWWRRARIACMRQARLPLRRLLHRPGRVWLSPHRIDLMLPLASADIRIRRAGYDIDPGYVPWLDCVIHFHYVR